MPVTDIDPTTVKVNGVAFPDATIAQDTDTANYLNGIPDAIITISPRSALNLPNGSQTITITGQDAGDLAAAQLHLDRHGHRHRHRRHVDAGQRGRRRRSRDRPGHRDPVRLAVRGQSIHAVVDRPVGLELSADPAGVALD